MQNHQRLRFSLLVVAVVAAVGASRIWAGGPRERGARSEDVTLTGKLVDMQSFMTGKSAGTDPAKAAQQCLRSGVPAVLETEEGLVVIGMGERGPSRLIVPLALKRVELKGKLYEKEGLQYIDITSARLAEEQPEETEHPDQPEPVDPSEEEEPEEEPAEEEP